MPSIRKLSHSIYRYNQGCRFFTQAMQAWQAGDILEYEAALRTAATEAIGSLEWFLKIYLRNVIRDSLQPSECQELKHPNFDTLMKLAQKHADPPLDSTTVTQLYIYRDALRNAAEHDASVPSAHELCEAISAVRQFALAYLPLADDQLQIPSLPGRLSTPPHHDQLASQLKDWFTTLGYQLEAHHASTDCYFEWIVDVPARRGYDRILVLGVEGEIGLHDLEHLRNLVAKHATAEGWLISSTRVSQAARDALQPEASKLYCYTFDELIEQTADFTGYQDWLEAEIKSRGIDKYYVPLACVKKELTPASSFTIGQSRYDGRNGWIDGYIDRWLDDPSKEHLSVLGEFGTGKTWFALHYAWQQLQRYREAKARGVARPRLPLVIPLRHYAKAVSVESLFSEFFFRKHEIPLPGYSAFQQLNRMGKLLLIFDGFDEMASRIDRQKMINNFWELARVVVPGAKVILTCRTEHFPDARESRALLGAELRASVANLSAEAPQFEVLELEPLDEDQVRLLLAPHAAQDTVDRIVHDDQLLDLAKRPVMAELILESLPDIEAGRPVDLARVYLYAVRRKMERDIRSERTFTSLADKLYFLCETSWEMLSTGQMSLNYRQFPPHLRRLFGPQVQDQKDLDHWHYDMMGQTMLIRNEDGDYAPAHRSLLEFFVAYKLTAELGLLAPDFEEPAKLQSNIDASAASQDTTWSSYFRRQVDDHGRPTPAPPLNRFSTEPLEVLRDTFGKMPLSPTLLHLMTTMLDPSRRRPKRRLLSLIRHTQDTSPDQTALVGGNSATLLLSYAPGALKGQDLSRTMLDNLQASDLLFPLRRSPDLSGAAFTGASLQHAHLGHANLRNARFRCANLTDLTLRIEQNDGLSLHPSGRLLAVSSYRDILLWDLTSHSLLARTAADGPWEVCYSPDGAHLVSTRWGGFDVRDPATLHTLSTHQNSTLPPKILHNLDEDDRDNLWVAAFAFTPDSRYLYAGCNNSGIFLWDIRAGKELARFLGHTSCVNSLALSPDGKLLLSSAHREIICWDVPTHSIASQMAWPDAHLGNAVFHPTDPLALVASDGDAVLALDPTSMSVAYSIPLAHDANHLALNADGSLLAVVGWRQFTLLEYASQQEAMTLDLHQLSDDEHGFIDATAVCFHPTANLVYLATHNGYVAVIDIAQRRIVDNLWHLPDVAGADFSGAIGLDDQLTKQLRAHGAIT